MLWSLLVFVLSLSTVSFGLPVAPPPSSQHSDYRAFWISRTRIGLEHYQWATYALRVCVDCLPDMTHGGEETEHPLTFVRFLTADSYALFPNLDGYVEVALNDSLAAAVPTFLRGGLSIVQRSAEGALLQLTGVQVQGVIDDLYANDEPLGVRFDAAAGTVSLSLWAPTAVSVAVDFVGVGLLGMEMDATTGVWHLPPRRRAELEDREYIYVVDVFVHQTGRMETNRVTDPYSVALTIDSTASVAVDLSAARWKPPGWDSLRKPPYTAPEDIVIYETHVREFSANDSSVPAAIRGKYAAFAQPDSDGVRHLRRLAQAGFTHVHLLPFFDCATIIEDPAGRTDPQRALLETFPGDSAEQQALVGELRQVDSWNWCYDPFHYGVPEGSYAADGHVSGGARVLQFREMVQAINEQIGMRVVMDVVFNHVSQAGQQAAKAVLDRIVPGYYLRLSNSGVVQTQTCCPDTATEFRMMERLMIDMLVQWTEAYQLDGYRFDLQGFHTKANMVLARDTLAAQRGDLYIYGEGWAFGSLQAKGFEIASQFAMAGTGIGTFNDRIRDALHGGSREDEVEIRTQGFINGLSYDWNGHLYGGRYRDDLLHKTDVIKIGIAGNLQNYEFVDRYGNVQTGVGLDGVGYALDPQEAVQYHTSHDDQDLWDLTAYKAPAAVSKSDRGRIQNLGLAVVLLSQGVPFFTAGEEMLRSKSLDRNTYDSGDWFNTLDWTLTRNAFPAGLPSEWGNAERWEIAAEILRMDIAPTAADIRRSVDHACEFAAIRKSTAAFRLRDEAAVRSRLRFFNDGPTQIDALIAFLLRADSGSGEEPIVVVVNADKFEKTIVLADEEVADLSWRLHPVLQNSTDAVVRTATASAGGVFRVPYRTTAVFVPL